MNKRNFIASTILLTQIFSLHLRQCSIQFTTIHDNYFYHSSHQYKAINKRGNYLVIWLIQYTHGEGSEGVKLGSRKFPYYLGLVGFPPVWIV